MRHLPFFFFLLLYLPAFTQANNSPLVLTHITEENGLSDNHITCVYKDKDELLWIGTQDGLNLLDGSTIHFFKNIPGDSNSIGNNYISGITEDTSGKIWIATASGFCCYDKHSKKFTNIQYYGPDKTYFGGVSNLAISSGNNIWFGTASGLFSYEIGPNKISRYFNNSTQFETDPRYSNTIIRVLIASDNKIWLCTGDGLWNFSPSKNIFTKIIHKQNDLFYHPLCKMVYEDHEKNIWAGFWNTGLRKYEPATGKLTDYGGALDHSYTISAISEVKQPGGKTILWLNGNLLAFDENANKYFSFSQPITEKDFPDVDPVYQSADGWVWLSSDNGLYIYNPQRQVFNHQFFSSGLTSQGINFLDYKNGLLVAAQGRDFLKWKDRQGNVLKNYSFLANKNTASLCIKEDGPDNFWMGTTDGILHINLATGSKKWFTHSESDSTTIPRNFITALFIDSKKNLWVFPWREGIWQMDKETGACKKLLDGFITESGKIKKLLISDAVEDADGNIWMTDLDEGIILYDARSKQFSKPFEKEIGAKTHTDRIFIRNGMIYSALDNSIVKWDIHQRKLEQFHPPAELNKTIKDFYPDKNGNWWLATVSGLIVFNETDKTFRRFTTTDGLYQNDVSGTLFCSADSNMIIGASTYFSYFKPAQLNVSSAGKKNIIVTGFFANNKNITIPGDNIISLHHSENNIIIRWALPAYGNPFRNQYYYRLQGIDSGWRYIGNKGEVQYANLSPGHYNIFLKAATSNDTESGNIISLKFIIHQPYWKTTWFILLSLIAIGALFVLVVRYISQRNLKEKLLLLEKEQAVEKERNRISRDMHDDLGSGLTKIAIMSEVVKKQINEPEKAKQQLENISESSRELVDSLQDIIWVLNPKNDTLESLASYTREYGLKFFEPFGINIQFDYPERFSNIKLSEEARRNIFMVIKETFNNSCKHAWCNNAAITIKQKASFIQLTIKDDGKGFDPEKVRPFSNGLINMKGRIEQIGGTYEITSAPGEGTTTTIGIPV